MTKRKMLEADGHFPACQESTGGKQSRFFSCLVLPSQRGRKMKHLPTLSPPRAPLMPAEFHFVSERAHILPDYLLSPRFCSPPSRRPLRP